MATVNQYSYEDIQRIANFLLEKITARPMVGIICGTGIGGIADLLEGNRVAIDYKDIPDFPVSTVAGHKGRLVFGSLRGIPTVCMQGRFHAYEGYPLWKCSMPVRVMKLLGIKTLIVTNAAGGLNPNYNVGDLMFIKDHINFPGLAGDSPLRGPNDERWGPRFPPVNAAYTKELRRMAHKVAQELGITDHVQEGVYSMVGGPAYETVAESRALRMLGADAVGMSTVHEVLTACHCGLSVFGLSLITNKVVVEFDSDQKANHEEVLQIGELRKKEMEKLVSVLVERIGASHKMDH